MTEAKIRYNTNYPTKSTKKWRLLWNGEQYLVDELEINCPTYTTQDKVKGDDGQMVEKFHISCKPIFVDFVAVFGTNQTKAVIK